MGVDANYIYGYMAEVDKVEWDIDYLKQKYDENKKVDGWLGEYYTYGDLINMLENDEVDDWDDLEPLGLKCKYAYNDMYLYFTHFELIEKFPDGKLGEHEELAKEYARQSGVKNTEVFAWNEFGYFD